MTKELKYSQWIREGDALGITWLYQIDKDYSAYWLQCGHTTKYQMSNIRRGFLPICPHCRDVDLRNDARAVGAEFLELLSNRRARYRLLCGHDHVTNVESVAKGSIPKCIQCVEDAWKADARKVGIEWISRGCGRGQCIYKLPCGCLVSAKVESVRRGGMPICKTHRLAKWVNEGDAVGITFIRQIDAQKAEYLLPCGCKAIARLDSVRDGSKPICKTHKEFKWQTDACAIGATWIRQIDKSSSEYLLSCGHISTAQMGSVALGSKPTCVICGDNHFTASSNVYLSLVSNSEHGQFYKLGTSNDLKRRLSSQELRSSDDTKTEHLAIKPMDSKLVAMKDEKSIHRKFKKFRPFFNKCPDWYQDGGTELIEINEVTTGFFNEYFSK